ncbi:hypothetical protein QYF36_022640 [Acer negundo]|nr:hypothetical protein QYF36_022640 [Acer negundo]
MIEQTGENKTKNEKNDKKYIDVSVGVNAESAVCANDEANAEEIDTEIGDCAAIRTVKPKNRLHGKLYGCFIIIGIRAIFNNPNVALEDDEDDSPEDGNIGSIVDPDVIEEGKPRCSNMEELKQIHAQVFMKGHAFDDDTLPVRKLRRF